MKNTDPGAGLASIKTTALLQLLAEVSEEYPALSHLSLSTVLTDFALPGIKALSDGTFSSP